MTRIKNTHRMVVNEGLKCIHFFLYALLYVFNFNTMNNINLLRASYILTSCSIKSLFVLLYKNQ